MRCAVMLLLAVGLWGQGAPYDAIISGARVVDGSGSPVADRAEYDKPHQYSVGVRDVLVNGKFVLRQDKVTAERPGRVLLGPSAER